MKNINAINRSFSYYSIALEKKIANGINDFLSQFYIKYLLKMLIPNTYCLFIHLLNTGKIKISKFEDCRINISGKY